MKRRTEMMRRTGTALLVALSLSTAALAAEVDRITVEDPLTSVVKFGVTSDGNVRGTSFAGDGAALTNVAHWKGTWSAATAYNKDESVNYAGSSYIALAASTNAQPSLTPASWAVLAQQGPAGAAGAAGAPGATGATGPQGPIGATGPAGSPDTQAQILGKLATATTGAVLTIQQNAGEPATNNKLSIKDSSGVDKVTFTPDGMLTVNSGGTSPTMILSSGTDVAGQAPTFVGRKARGTLTAPTAVQAGDNLFTLSGIGYNGTAWPYASTAIFMPARETFTPTAKGADVAFYTTQPGTINRTEKFRVTGEGNVGIGVVAPTQKLEVKDGGVRINNTLLPAAKPGCTSTIRGTFWLTQVGAGAMDTLEVCVKNASEAYVWKAVW